MDDDSQDTVTIGATVYRCVRKGPHHYRIVAGKRMTDAESCWTVCTGGGKTWFVNGHGERRWHLPGL